MDAEHMNEQITALEESFNVMSISKERDDQEETNIEPTCLLNLGNPTSLPDGFFENILANEQATIDELGKQIDNESERMRQLLNDIDSAEGEV
jgi:hypothetical protein